MLQTIASMTTRKQAPLLGLLLFAAVFLLPDCIVGYGGDDLLNACTQGHVRIRGGGFSDYLHMRLSGWMSAGRLFPLAIVQTYGLHYWHPSAALFHRLVYGVLLVDVGLFYGLLRAWRLAPGMAALGGLLLTLLFQMRWAFDPILQFAGLMPALATELLAALLMFDCYLRCRRERWRVASLAAFCLALLTYEIAFVAGPVFWFLARA